MATILYARVSTNKQTIEHQRTQAEQAGFRRPQGRRLFDLLRSGDALVVRWVDRLGRNYQDICDALREFTRRGVVIRTVINGITRSTARPRMLCNVPSVTRSSPSWRQLQRHKRKQPRKLSALASRTRKPIAMCEPARDASPATVPSSSRMRRRCWGNLEALARSPELQGLLARPSTASRMIRLRLRLDPELFGSQRPLLPLVYLVYICNQGILFNQWKAKQMSGSREGAP
jgi:resolvase-like protein